LSLDNEYSEDYTNILSHNRRNSQFINVTDLASKSHDKQSTIKLVNHKQQFFTNLMIGVTQCQNVQPMINPFKIIMNKFDC